MTKPIWGTGLFVFLMLAINPAMSAQAPMGTVAYVDLPRFMGDWYVIANIPTVFEKGAHNPVESYRLNNIGTIATSFTFNADSFDGEKKIHQQTGFVKNKQTNATWGMQIIWPIKADYRGGVSGPRLPVHGDWPQGSRLCVGYVAQPGFL